MNDIIDLAHSIVVKLEKAAAYDALVSEKLGDAKVAREKARNLRISAGVELAEAQRMVFAGDAGEITWTDWCMQNVPGRSESTIRKLLRLGKSDDPIAEDDRRRNQDTELQQNHRNNVDNRSDNDDVRSVSHEEHVENPLMTEAKLSFRRLTFSERGEFMKWVKQTGLY